MGSKHRTTDFEQLDLFTDYSALEKKKEEEEAKLKREKQMQQAMQVPIQQW